MSKLLYAGLAVLSAGLFASVATAQTASTTTALTSSANPSTYDQFVTLTATVTPSTATGSVTFMDGSNTLTVSDLSAGVATYTVNTLAAGTHSLTAVYSGDPNDTTSTSPALIQTVNPATSVLAVVSSANPSALGQSVTLFAAITPSIATGTVTFQDGSTILGTGTLSFGTATLVVTPNFSAGTHGLTATYSGDANDLAATSPPISQVVDQPTTATTISLMSAPVPSNLGQNVTVTATVTPSSATGNATFYDGTTVLGTKALAGGQATLTTNLLPAGVRSLKAYLGTGPVYASSTSAALPQTVRALPASGFAAAVSIPGTTDASYSLAVADFNGDGKADFVTTNFATVQVVLGNGDGTFQAPVGYRVGGDPIFATVGDFNGDGKTDIVASNFTGSGAGSVSVLLGNGDGTFQPAVSYPTADFPFNIAVADFNGDGKADLAITSNSQETVSILLGNGDGTFQAAANYYVGSFWGVVAGDFNGDGRADLAVGSFINGGNVQILLGNGDGTFQTGAAYPTSTDSLGLVVGDFNGDGKVDLASADYSSDNISVLLGNGDGTFQTAVNYGVAGTTYGIATGDFNGDGKADLAATNYTTGNLSVLLGNGDGTFQTAVTYGVAGTLPLGIAAGDFNGDSRTDLIVGDLSGGNVSILLGIPSNLTSTTTTLTSSVNPSTYGQAVTFTAAVSPSTATGTVTFSDGSTVLCTNAVIPSNSTANATCTNATLSAGSHSITAVYSGDQNDAGSASLALTQTVTGVTPVISGLMPSSARAGGPAFTLIVNGASFLSGATVNWGSTALSTTFVNATQLTAPVSMAQIASAGPVSVTVVNPGPVASSAATFTVNTSTITTTMLFSAPSPSVFGQAVTLTANVSQAAATGKVTFYDGSTVLGIGALAGGVAQLRTSLIPTGPGTLKAYYAGDVNYAPSTSGPAMQTVNANPSGTLATAVNYTTGDTPRYFGLGDFNGDGKIDVAVTYYHASGVGIYLGNGDGTFQAPLIYTVGTNPFSVVVGDFNGDGKADLAIANQSSGSISVLLGNGDGTFQAAVDYPTPAVLITAGDFNGDGRIDLAVTAGNSAGIMIGNGDGTFQPVVNYPTGGVSAVSIVAADFNADGVPDLALANFGSNNISVMLGVGDGSFLAGVTYNADSQAYSVATADLNGDGKLDLVVANTMGDDVSVFLGNGDGTFQAAVNYPAGTGPRDITIADVNGDGKLDVTVADNGASNVFVLPGNGDGTFGAAISYLSGGTTPTAVVVSDFNGDGRADLAVANYNGTDFSVLLGITAPTTSLLSTTSPATITVGTAVPLTVAVSDTGTAFNAPTGTATFLDGATVLGTATQTTSPYSFSASSLAVGTHTLTATYGGDTRSANSTSNTVTITVNSSVPTPTISSLAPASARAGGPAFTLTVNGTNFLSGATVDWGATALSTTFVNATQLTASVSMAQISSAGPVSVTVVNPGAVTSSASTFTVNASTVTTTMLLSSASPSTFGQTITLTANVSPGAATGKVTFYEGASMLGIGTLTGGVAQLTTSLLPAGRGILKAYYAGDVSYAPSTSALTAQTVNANLSGSLIQAVGSPFLEGFTPCAVVTGDFNGDGIQDLAVANNEGSNVGIFLGTGTGGFNQATGSPHGTGTGPCSVAIADFNGDGFQDVALGNQNTGNITVLLGNGAGNFSAAPGSPFPAGDNPFVTVGDFNGDGIPDLATANYGSNNVSVLLGDGSGNFSAAPGSPFPAGTFPVAILVGDFNGDGKADIATANFGGGNVTILLGNGAGGFSAGPGSPVAAGTSPRAIAIGDFNGDHVSDLAIANESGNNVTVLLGTGAGGFSAASGSPFPAGTNPFSVAVGDLNGDGIQDLAFSSSNSNNVTVLLGNGAGGFSAVLGGPITTDSSPVSLAVGDFNGDGLADLAVANEDSNDVTILLGGLATTSSLLSTTSPATITLGTAVPLTLAVSDTVTAFSAPTGTAAFYDGETLLGTATQTTPPYTFNVTGLAAGTHQLAAAYSGDNRTAGYQSNTVTITVTAQTPTISGLSPFSATAGGPAFTLTVGGTNFVSGSTVQWGATALATTFVSATQLTAPVSLAQIAAPGAVSVTVVNPGPVTSAASTFTILASTGQTWTQLMPTGGPPSAREGAGAVFDLATTHMILFGGAASAGYVNDTWSLNTTTNQWSQLTPAGAAPAARRGESAVYDSVNSIMTVFGGQESGSCANDVWTLSKANGSAGTPTWAQLNPAGTAPAPRSFGQAVYDPGSDSMIVFGGNNCSLSVLYNDVWVLANANGLGGTPAWTQLTPTGTLPSARNGASAVYDPASNELIIFGGSTGGADASDVWVLSNANGIGGAPAWTQVTTTGGAIPARGFHTAVYDSASNRMTVFGGFGAGALGFSDTWVLTNANNSSGTPTWMQLAASGTIPSGRAAQTAILDPTTNRMIVFGGFNSGFVNLNDVWTLSDANNVTPSISSLTPNSVTAGGAGFTITVNGQGFASGAVVNWGDPALTTTFVNSTQLTALVPANLIAAAGMASVTVVNPGGATSAPATFTINSSIQPLSITSGAPPNGTVNVSYGPFTLMASGGSGSYLWAASGVTGLTVNAASGSLSGTPTVPGNFTLRVTLTDANNLASSISQNYSVTIAAAPLTITTSSLPSGIQNRAYSASLAGGGGSGSYNWAISGIAGLTVNASTGGISGSPTAGGNLTLTVTLSDAVNTSAAPATRQLAVAITLAPLTITTPGALGEFAPNGAISKTFAATGGSPAFTWSASGVPATLTLNPATGQITGNAPAMPGNYSFPLKVSDTQTPAASDSTTVTFSVLGITTSTTLPSGTTSTAYSLNLIAAGGMPPYAFSSPGVPAGLTLSSSGFLSGTPTQPITSSFQVLVTDVSGIPPVAGTFSLTVATGVQPIQVTGATLPDASLTTSYSQPLEAQNGQPSYNWTVLGGSLPAGLALSSAGTITGTPTAIGQATFTARATDAAGGFASGVFSINVNPAALQITAAALPNAMAGLPYGAQPINATGGFPPYTFAITQGSPPSPLTFASGQINSGVPAAAGTSNFTVTVTDAMGSTASGSFTLVVEPNQPDLILSQGTVSFSIVTGDVTLPAAANVTVGSSVAASLGYTVQVNPPAPWLDVSPNGSTPGTVTIGLDAASAPPLSKGIYQTTVTVACLPFSGCSGSHNVAVSLTVTAPAPQLSVGTNLLSFTATDNSSQTLAQPLNLKNSGGGVVTIQSVSAADSWVKFDPATIPPPPMPLSAGQTLQVNVFVDTTVLPGPGYYQSTITVTTDAGSASVPVTVLIATNATMTLAPAGSQFNTVAGNAPSSSSGSFLVTVSGNSTVNWTAAILPTSPAATWLTLNTPSGSSTSASPGAVSFTINGNVASLAAQPYYATIEITSTGSSVTDPVQDYQVVLNVAPAGNIAAPNPDPSGLIFISTGPGALPAQVVQVGSSSGGVVYTAKSDSPSWLSVTPGSGNASSAAPGQSSVSVNTAGLPNGVYHGGINYAIAGQVRTVNVTLIEAVPAAGAVIPGGVSGKAVPPGCTATQIIPTQTGLVNNFSLPTAWPTPLKISVVDDCGKAVTAGQVVATFSNGDPPLVLPGVGGSAGVYSGTWTPRATASQVTISAQASAQGFKPASVQITGQVTRNGAPVLNLGGTLNAFVPVVGSPLSPGMIVQIYGSNLASQVVVSSVIPLTTSLNNTSVIIGGIAAPLYYVSPGQINAQVPFELAQGASYQVIVNANGALSTPNPIQIAGDAPGIAAFASGGIIAQHGDGSLVTEAAPAVPGEYIVFYVSGMGQTDNPVASGAASPGSPLARPTDPPTLTLNGVNVPVAFAGLTPTLVGLYQVNFQVPANTPNGDLQLVLTQTGGQSNATILAVHN